MGSLKKLLPLLSIILSLGCQQQTIHSFLENEFNKGKLNGNVLVLKDDKVLFEGSYGFTNETKKTNLTSDYRFDLGSIYKEFPAVAIMQLTEKGLLDVNDKVSDHLNDLPEWSDKVTITQLLQYSSGLPKVNWGGHPNISDDDIYYDLQNLVDLEFEPGEGYLYTNNSPFLLSRIVQSVSEMEFSEYIQKEIFTPYELNETVMSEAYPFPDTTLMAIPFGKDLEPDRFEISARSVLFQSTTYDMARWIKLIDSYRIINKESLLFLTKTTNVRAGNKQSPLGECVLENGDLKEHTHHGSSGNYEAVITRLIDEDLTIIILTNQNNGNVLNLADKLKAYVLQSDSTL